jgi:hypothetical protein
MMRRYGIAAVVLTVAVTGIPAEPIKMQSPVTFPMAGVRVALPAGFEVSPRGSLEEVFTATRVEGRQAVQSIAMMMYPVSPDASPEDFAQRMHDDLSDQLAVRHMKVLKSEPFRMAGREGVVRSMSYTYRGTKTEAVSACVARDLKRRDDPALSPARRVMLVLTTEVAVGKNTDRMDLLLGTFEAVNRTLELIAPRRPVDLPVTWEKAVYRKDFQTGLALKQPDGWVGGVNTLGPTIGAMDLMIGGHACPSVQALAVEIETEDCARDAAMRVIEHERAKGMTVRILQQGEAMLARKKGYQFIVRKLPPVATTEPTTQPTEPPAAWIEAQRIICIPDPVDQQGRRAYGLIVTARGVSPQKLQTLTDELAKGFSLFTPVGK